MALLTSVAQSTPARAAVLATTPALQVRVATWNVFDLPEQFFAVASSARLRQVPAALASVAAPLSTLDAVVFEELYVERDRERVLSALAALGLPYVATLGGTSMLERLRLAGVVVASRWPIDRVKTHLHASGCRGLDCLTRKGTIYARLQRPHGVSDVPIHLFATHFYFGGLLQGARLRRMQAEDLAAFIAAQGLGDDAPVILAGDLNADWRDDGPALLQALGAYPATPGGALDHTFGGEDHPFVAGSPRDAVRHRCARVGRAASGAEDKGHRWLDYVVSLRPGQPPVRTSMQAHAVHGAPYPLGDPARSGCWLTALSDHAPVVGTFVFSAAP